MKFQHSLGSVAKSSLVFLFFLPLFAHAQTPLNNGEAEAGTILANTTNSYSFGANTGDSIVLRLGTTGFDGELQLYGPTGALLVTAASGVDAELDYTATNTGSFKVLVFSYSVGGSGTYVMYFSQFPESFIVPAGQQGGPMSNGGDYTGTNKLGTLAMWSFTANAKDSIVLRLGATGYDGNLRLYGPTGALLGTAASGNDAELDYTATNSGTFTALVSSYESGGIGTYMLHLSQFPEAFIVPPGQQGGPITNGGDYSGTNSLGDTAMWSFAANAGDNIALRLGTTGYNGYLRLYGPTGALLGAIAAGNDAELDYTATNSGTFTALTCSYGSGGFGTYVLYFAEFPEAFIVPPGQQGGPITNGGDYSGTNSRGGLAMWSFTANAGDNIALRLGTTGYNGYLRLYGSNGALLGAIADGNDAELDYTATNTGTFTALTCSYGSGGFGTYVLYFAEFPEAFIVPPGQAGGPMTNGGDYAATNSLGNLAIWSFAASAGNNIVLRLGTTGYDGNLRLYGPTGALLQTMAAGDDAEVAYTATNSGTFKALVSSYSSGGVGTYMLHLALFPEAFIVPTGQQGGAMSGATQYNGTITLGDLEIWAFTACTGDHIDLQLIPTNFTGDLNLYGPTGVLLQNAISGSAAVITYTATNCGTFGVLVSSYSSGGVGTYGLIGNELSDGLKLCPPAISGTNLTLNGIGGTNNVTFTLYAVTNLLIPFDLWTPVFTNEFNQIGIFAYSNFFNAAQPQDYFRFVIP